MPIFDVYSYLGGSIVPGVAANPGSITATMQARGVDGAILCSAHACRVDPLAGNRILKAMVEQMPHLYACLACHVNRVDASLNAMRELAAGRKFLGMLLVSTRPDEGVSRIVAEELINAFRRYSKPLFFLTPNAEAVHTALEIAQQFSMLKVICVGMGGADWRAAISAAHVATNIMLETSGALDRAKLPAAVEVLGAHRILFGSGSPHLDRAAALGLIEDSPLSEDARRRILFENAQKLFELPPPAR